MATAQNPQVLEGLLKAAGYEPTGGVHFHDQADVYGKFIDLLDTLGILTENAVRVIPASSTMPASSTDYTFEALYLEGWPPIYGAQNCLAATEKFKPVEGVDFEEGHRVLPEPIVGRDPGDENDAPIKRLVADTQALEAAGVIELRPIDRSAQPHLAKLTDAELREGVHAFTQDDPPPYGDAA